MRSLVGTAALSEVGTFAGETGTWSADYPATNLADLRDLGNPARVTPDTGSVAFTFVFAANQSVGFLALADHAIPAGGEVQVELFSDATMLVLTGDTGSVVIPDPVSDVPQTFPVALDAPLTIRALRVTITGLTDDLDIGGCAVGTWWEWPYIAEGMDAGLKASGKGRDLVGGASVGASGRKLRTRSGSIGYLDLSVSTTTAIDFMKAHGLTAPFVFVEDYSDPDTWPRECFTARNSELSPLAAALFDHDTYQFRFEELA